ncbi:MAG TPA: LTA synthase family protein [Chromobacteriaceae bacterium]|nr:LTA synthase family protein [Chromobacteriaceae bacterium]
MNKNFFTAPSPSRSTSIKPSFYALQASWGIVIAAAIMFFALRLALIAFYAKPLPSLDALGEWPHALLLGARFDLKIGAIVGALFSLGGLLVRLVPEKFQRQKTRALRLTLISVLFIFSLIGIINLYYYGFYQSPINAIIFGLFEDDTSAVLHTVWDDYPFVTLIACISAATYVSYRAINALASRQFAWHASRRGICLAIALHIVIMAVLIRGSLGIFPLREMDMAISTNPLVNASVPNGMTALYIAYSERKQQALDGDPAVTLKKMGYPSALAAAKALGLPATQENQVENALFAKTAVNPWLAKHPPHVVFCQMEGWGQHLMDYQSAKNNVMGELANQLDKLVWYKNFTSSQYGTHPSLESLILNTPITPLTQSSYGFKPYGSSIAWPFKRNGYHTLFVTSGSGMWRNLSNRLPVQGFDEVADQNTIIKANPAAGRSLTTWGVYDGYMFSYVEQRLRAAEAKGQKLFVYILSTTAHPPYTTPPDYHVLPVDYSVYQGNVNKDRPYAESILKSYQYQTDALGWFVHHVSDADFGSRTIIGMTGDHNTRSFYHYTGTDDILHNYGVPLMLYVPAAYQANWHVDASVYGSHRDIFPTLINLALSDTAYYRSGQNLLAANARQNGVALSVYDVALTGDGAVPDITKKQFMKKTGKEYVPCKGADCPVSLESMRRKEQAYVGLMDWYIRQQANRKNH